MIESPCSGRSKLQDLNNILGALYLVMVFLGIINATSVQPVAYTERSVRNLPLPFYVITQTENLLPFSQYRKGRRLEGDAEHICSFATAVAGPYQRAFVRAFSLLLLK